MHIDRRCRAHVQLLPRCKHVSDASAAALAAAAGLQEVSLMGTAVSAHQVAALAAARSLQGRPWAACHLLHRDAHAAQPAQSDDWRGVVQWMERCSLLN
jgi:hypothetical protein